jgi:hypothetical protein
MRMYNVYCTTIVHLFLQMDVVKGISTQVSRIVGTAIYNFIRFYASYSGYNRPGCKILTLRGSNPHIVKGKACRSLLWIQNINAWLE